MTVSKSNWDLSRYTRQCYSIWQTCCREREQEQEQETDNGRGTNNNIITAGCMWNSDSTSTNRRLADWPSLSRSAHFNPIQAAHIEGSLRADWLMLLHETPGQSLFHMEIEQWECVSSPHGWMKLSESVVTIFTRRPSCDTVVWSQSVDITFFLRTERSRYYNEKSVIHPTK